MTTWQTEFEYETSFDYFKEWGKLLLKINQYYLDNPKEFRPMRIEFDIVFHPDYFNGTRMFVLKAVGSLDEMEQTANTIKLVIN